jgi:hypothetical protein
MKQDRQSGTKLKKLKNKYYMATKNIQIRLSVSPEVKADMDLLYKAFYGSKSKDANGRWRIDVSQSKYWEDVIYQHLESEIISQFLMEVKSGKIK